MSRISSSLTRSKAFLSFSLIKLLFPSPANCIRLASFYWHSSVDWHVSLPERSLDRTQEVSLFKINVLSSLSFLLLLRGLRVSPGDDNSSQSTVSSLPCRESCLSHLLRCVTQRKEDLSPILLSSPQTKKAREQRIQEVGERRRDSRRWYERKTLLLKKRGEKREYQRRSLRRTP
jgi:hypothetical protein